MEANTIDENSRRVEFDTDKPLWVFGYGSLIFKPDYAFIERKPASIVGWQRRFWQGSHDHRGTPQSPGRVVTLVECENAICKGMAYLIDPAVLSHLDFREKNGYLRFMIELNFEDQTTQSGLIYIATHNNEAYLGETSEAEIARQISRSIGPSGKNIDYLFNLADALRKLEAEDPHVFAIERYLRQQRAEVD